MSQPSGQLSVKEHLETALEHTESEKAKYHIREAHQKCIAFAAPFDDE